MGTVTLCNHTCTWPWCLPGHGQATRDTAGATRAYQQQSQLLWCRVDHWCSVCASVWHWSHYRIGVLSLAMSESVFQCLPLPCVLLTVKVSCICGWRVVAIYLNVHKQNFPVPPMRRIQSAWETKSEGDIASVLSPRNFPQRSWAPCHHWKSELCWHLGVCERVPLMCGLRTAVLCIPWGSGALCCKRHPGRGVFRPTEKCPHAASAVLNGNPWTHFADPCSPQSCCFPSVRSQLFQNILDVSKSQRRSESHLNAITMAFWSQLNAS